MVVLGFSQIFASMVELFGLIYTTGGMLFQWLSTPLFYSVGSDAASILGDLVSYSPMDLIFGPGLLVVLVLCLVKFVIPS